MKPEGLNDGQIGAADVSAQRAALRSPRVGRLRRGLTVPHGDCQSPAAIMDRQ